MGLEQSVIQRVQGEEAMRIGRPLKPKLDEAMDRIGVQSKSLNRSSDVFRLRYNELFNELVNCYQRHDTVKAKILADELAEIQKLQKMTLEANIALEQISMRLQTVTDVGDIAASLAPVVDTARDMKGSIKSVSPSASNGVDELGDLLAKISNEAGAISGTTINFNTPTEDSVKILTEAATLAEQRMKTRFPEPEQARRP